MDPKFVKCMIRKKNESQRRLFANSNYEWDTERNNLHKRRIGHMFV